MRIALAQANSIPGDFSGTVRHMLDFAERAARLGADLVVFPSTIMGGAYPLGLGESQAFQLALLDAIEDYAARTSLTSVVPAYVFDGELGYTEVFLCEDGVAGPLRLREAGRSANEGRLPDTLVATAFVAGANIQFLAGDTGASSHDADCDALVVLSALPFCDQDSSTLLAPGLGDGSLQGMVTECPCPIAMLQGVGGYDDVVLAGGSFAASAEGTILAACPSFEEALVTFDVEPSLDADELAFEGSRTRCAPASWGTLGGVGTPASASSSRTVPAGSTDAPGPVVPAGDPGIAGLVGTDVCDVPVLAPRARTGLLWRALVLATRDYVRKCGFSDVIVGLSGGIDSSVVAAIAADALGPEHVLGILMPGPFSSAASVADAEALATNLGIETRTVGIAGLYEAASALYTQALGAPFSGVAAENLQARLRGTTLMSLANARGALVLNTGNKSESGMGYSTLYGDTVGAYAPLSDVYKGRVYDLARWRNARDAQPPIPENVLTKAPSAELSAGQTDEGSFGVSYPEIERILTMHVERGMDADQIVAAGAASADVQRVLDACRLAEFKRRQEPMGPIVSLRPFVDRGWPVVLGWRDRAHATSSTSASASDTGADASGKDGSAPSFETQDPSPVAVRLDEMVARLVHQDQIVSTLSDVAYSSLIARRGPDMDSALGIPLFSKN